MLSSCLGYQKPVARSVSPIPDESSDDDQPLVDYSPAVKLEESTICLQTTQRKAFNEFIQILSKSSEELEKWKQRWHRTSTKHQDDATGPEANWKLFDACVLSVDHLIEQTNQSISELTTANDAIPKLPKKQSLRFKINQARAEVNSLTKELDALEEEKHNLERKVHRSQSTVSSKSLETRDEALSQRRRQIKAQIKSKRKALDEQQTRFWEAQDKFYERSKRNEIERCGSLKVQLEHFVEALQIESDDFAGKSRRFNAKENLKEWEEHVLHRHNLQSSKSESVDHDRPIRRDPTDEEWSDEDLYENI